MAMDGADAVAAAFQTLEHRVDLRMVDRSAVAIGDQILLADIGDVRRIAVLGEQMVIGCSFAGRISSGIASYHSSLFAKTGSMSNTTPRKSNIRWRTISPGAKRARPMSGAVTVAGSSEVDSGVIGPIYGSLRTFQVRYIPIRLWLAESGCDQRYRCIGDAG